jgi:hypothetical protein
MANTFAATLAALSPNHNWAIDETSGLFIDSGVTGGIDCAEHAAGGVWRQAPGPIRGTPREYALWGDQTAGSNLESASTALTAVGFITGTMIAVVHTYSLNTETIFPLTQVYANNVGIFVGIRINTDGSVEYIADGASGFNDGFTAAGAITEGSKHLIVGVQRADGNGPRVYIDGVDVTSGNGQSGGFGVDDWVDQIIGAQTATDFNIGGLNNVAQGGAIIQRPAIWRNTALTDPQIASLFGAIGGFDQAPTDWYEKVFDLANGFNLNYWYTGYTGSSGRITGWVEGAAEADMPLGSSTGSSPNVENVVDGDIVSAFNARKQHFDTPPNASYQASTLGTLIGAADTIGTVNIVAHITSAPIGVQKNMVAFGDVSADRFEISIVGTAFGYEMQFRMEINTGAFVQAVGESFFTSLPQYMMFTVVQDGTTGYKLYINGSPEDFAESGGGGAVDEDSWLAQIAASASGDNLRFSAIPGSSSVENFQPNDIAQIFILRRALSSLEVSELYDALLGIFPPEGSPPAGGFFDTLNGTGNELTVNGPGPNHWWRMNVSGAPIDDIGLNDNPVPDGLSILTGGDPAFEVAGPLIEDPTNEAIYFDGQGDYFEIGANFVSGELVDSAIGTIGFFVSRNDLVAMIAYSQANDLATAFLRIGVNTSQQIELVVQTSAGNNVTLASDLTIDNLDYIFAVVTNDGSNYLLYFEGAVDSNATVVEVGTGLEGDWFDSFTATRSAVAALASSSFPTNTNGRFSEIFIYEEVLSAAQIGALFDAAVASGLGSSATSVGVLSFEDVTFLNGARADIRLSNSLTTFSQVLQVNRSRFIGGLESEDAESISLTGEVRASVRGCTFDLDKAPTTGRAAVLATTADPTTGASVYGNLLVSDCTFNRMGHGDTAVHPAVFAESGFGMTVEKSRFLDSYVGAVGWRADARRILVANNIIAGVTNAAAAISSQVGLNTNIGNAWRIGKNTILDVLVGNGISLAGANSSAASFARDISLIGNNIQSVVQDGIILTQIQDLLAYGNRIGGAVVEGISIGNIAGLVQIRRNFIEDNTAEGIVMDEAATRIATLIIDRNTVNGASVGDGMLFDGIDELVITNNKFLNLVDGLTLGEIGSSAKFFGNQFDSVSVPLAFVAATTQVGLEIGQNQMASLGVEELTVATEIISVFAQDHTVTLAAPANLATINGMDIEGLVMVLRLAVGSSDVTVVDTDNINLDAATDFVMDIAGESQIWLVSDGAGGWNELSRAAGS